MTKVEIENQLINEIHHLPIEITEELLRWILVIKKITSTEIISQSTDLKPENVPLSASNALKNFLKKYESDPIDIDTSIFEQYREIETDRDFRL